ncbi:MAG: hypothetical protein ACOCX5_03265 [Chloroflexota bacterium]
MSDLKTIYNEQGATLAADGIPIHFGDEKAEYEAALNTVVLLDRSHEGRILLTGRDRIDLLNRISTNELLNLSEGQGRATILVNANGRVLDRIVVYHRDENAILVTSGPGRNNAVGNYLQANIFYQDQVAITNLRATTSAFALHGPRADSIIALLSADALGLHTYGLLQTRVDDIEITLLRVHPLSEAAWTIIVSSEQAPKLWQHLIALRSEHGVQPAGGLTYNALRIRAGWPGEGSELTDAYIPLELGLWDEVSFAKGCYTGQEIIARMESRGRLAKALVRVDLDTMMKAPADIFAGSRLIGKLTSSTQTPLGELFAMGVVKVDYARAGARVKIGSVDGPEATVVDWLGTRPPFVETEN